MVRPAFDIAQLTVAERLDLIEELWASLAARPDALPLSAAQLALVAERRREHSGDPESAVAWQTVRTELLVDQEADERAAEQGAMERRG